MKKYALLLVLFIGFAINSRAQTVSFYKGSSQKGTLLSADSIAYSVNDVPCTGFNLAKCLPVDGRIYIIEFTYHHWVFTTAIQHVFTKPGDDMVIEIFETQVEIPADYDIVSIDSSRYAPEAVINCKTCRGTYIAVGEKE